MIGEDQFWLQKKEPDAIGMLRIISKRFLLSKKKCVSASLTGRKHLTGETKRTSWEYSMKLELNRGTDD